jgi:hypothetical protein
MDSADLLQSNIDLHQKQINFIINYILSQKKHSIYTDYIDKLVKIGKKSMEDYLLDNPDFMKIILKEFEQRKILIKLYKKKIKENLNDSIKLNILQFGLKFVMNDLLCFQNEHKNIFKKNMYLI